MKLPLQAANYHLYFKDFELEENSLTSLLISSTKISQVFELDFVDEHTECSDEQMTVNNEFSKIEIACFPYSALRKFTSSPIA